MNKIISLSIAFFSSAYASCSFDSKQDGHAKKPLTAAIFSENIHISSSGEFVCQRAVSVTPDQFLHLPFEFTNIYANGRAGSLKLQGLDFGGKYIEATLPENPSTVKPKALPRAFDEGFNLIAATPLALKGVHFKPASWKTASK